MSYIDCTKKSISTIISSIRNSKASRILKLKISSKGHFKEVEKGYSEYGKYQLYYEIDKEDATGFYITAAKSVETLQAHLLGMLEFEDKEKEKLVEDIINSNARRIPRGDGSGFEDSNIDEKSIPSYKSRLRDNWAVPSLGTGTINITWGSPKPDSDRLSDTAQTSSEIHSKYTDKLGRNFICKGVWRIVAKGPKIYKLRSPTEVKWVEESGLPFYNITQCKV